ncbi:MAG: hypothetical protein KTR18_09340 [Acidiferrobacterales bacterium]|nr:hypothetical protein [Acidiferrobacterales bacterium]
MKELKTLLSFCAVGVFSLIATGCTTISTKNALEVSLFRDDGQTPSREALAQIQAENYEDGIIYEVKAGDVVLLDVEKTGELFRIRETDPIEIEFTEDIYVYISQRGVYASKDGQEFEPIKEMLSGGVTVGFSMKETDRLNRLTVRMALHRQ